MIMVDRLIAHFENREYFFKVIKQIPADRDNETSEELHIDMYGTVYIFIKSNGQWQNKRGNRMNMVRGLIEAVITAVQK